MRADEKQLEFHKKGATLMANEMQKSDADKRYLPRWEVKNRVAYRLDNDRELREGQTRDISCTGACISVNEYLKPNQKVNMTIYLTDGKSINLDGRVIWIKLSEYENEIGIQFENMESKSQELILDHAFELDHNKLVDYWFKGWDGKT